MSDNAQGIVITFVNFKIITAIAAFGFLLPTVILGQPMLAQGAADNVTYISGGIGEEAGDMRNIAKDYPIEIVFVQKLGLHEEFLANVKVKIQDMQTHTMLDMTTDGPVLVVNLPAGKYQIIADYNNDVKQQKVVVNTKKNQKVVFWWPIVDKSHVEESSE